MGKLIIDGNSVFEIDEDCIKQKKIPKECDVQKYITKSKKNTKKQANKQATE